MTKEASTLERRHIPAGEGATMRARSSMCGQFVQLPKDPERRVAYQRPFLRRHDRIFYNLAYPGRRARMMPLCASEGVGVVHLVADTQRLS